MVNAICGATNILRAIKVCRFGRIPTILYAFLFISIWILSAPAACATKIVLVGCADGLVVVSDKRQGRYYPGHEPIISDEVKKTRKFGTTLVGQTGSCFQFRRSAPRKRLGYSYTFFGLSFSIAKKVSKKFDSADFSELVTRTSMADYLCHLYKKVADEPPSPWKLEQQDFVSSTIFVKTSPDRQTIDVVQIFIGGNETSDNGRQIVVNKVSYFSYHRGQQFCKSFGLEHDSESRCSMVLPVTSQLESLELAESEVYRASLRTKKVGPIVDEFFVPFDGPIRCLRRGKHLSGPAGDLSQVK